MKERVTAGKKERGLREKREVKVSFKVLVDVNEFREFGGDLPQTEFTAFWYDRDQSWSCTMELMDEVIEAKTVNKLIKKLEAEIRMDEVIESVKFDEAK